MNIGNMIRSLVLWLVAFIAPYFLDCLMKVAVPLFGKSLMAVLGGTADGISKAKAEVKDGWKSFVANSQATSQKTSTPIDDYVFGYLAGTELDDLEVEKIFDLAVKVEARFLHPSQGTASATPAPAAGN
jgi:hypothetical protein